MKSENLLTIGWIPPSKWGEGVAWPEDRVHWDAEPEKQRSQGYSEKKALQFVVVSGKLSLLLLMHLGSFKVNNE